MSIVKKVSTINIKPQSLSTYNIKPISVNTITYSAYVDPDDINYYGGFVYGAKKYGTTTQYSIGQLMPAISTEVI